MANEDENDESNDRIEAYRAFEYSSLQIHREVLLVYQRLRWFLTFNGLIFASYILSFRIEGLEELGALIRGLFSIAGFTLSATIILSLRASQNMRDGIKSYWSKLKHKGFPPFFSERAGSRLGRVASLSIPLVVGTMWIVLLMLPFVAPYFIPQGTV